MFFELFFLIILASGVIVLFLTWYYFECKKALAATIALCDAETILVDWLIKNPGVYVGLSEEGRTLVHLTIIAYDKFLETHKFINDNGYRKSLEDLLWDFPPKSPEDVDSKTEVLKNTSFLFEFFFLILVVLYQFP